MTTNLLAVVLAILAGAAWRRWWGWLPASWWPWKRANGDGIGYRAFQAVVGFVTLALILWLAAGAKIESAAIVSGIVLGFLSSIAQSVPHIWKLWELIDGKIKLPRFGTLIDGWTCYAELTCGAFVWVIAALVV